MLPLVIEEVQVLRQKEDNRYFHSAVKIRIMSYKVPPRTSIGHVHLKVSDINRALRFYRDLLGFEVMQWYGDSAVFLSAGGYHHHIGLNTWYSKGGSPAPIKAAGLFHVAILYPQRKDLAEIVKRLLDGGYPLTGASDHGVSEAVYLNDPDDNGIELYWDKPKEAWPIDEKGNLSMITEALDLENLLREIPGENYSPE